MQSIPNPPAVDPCAAVPGAEFQSEAERAQARLTYLRFMISRLRAIETRVGSLSGAGLDSEIAALFATIRDGQQRLGTDRERPGDYERLCEQVHLLNNRVVKFFFAEERRLTLQGGATL
jgi:hypothetical protein